MFRTLMISFVTSGVLTWFAIKTAKKFRILDHPDKRKVHTSPKPLLGGVAVFLAYIAALVSNFHFSRELKGVVIAAFFIMLSGLMDDVKELSAAARLIIQILCSLVVISFGVCLKIIPESVPYAYFLEVVITVLWIVGITNAVNFMDGIDGLAGGLTFIASMAFFIIAYQTGQIYFAFLNIAMAGACLGFLVFNFHPAKIFLGDAGSSFLGFSLAAFAVMGEWGGRSAPVITVSIPILILAVVIFDMIYISVSRVIRKQVRTFKEWIEYVGKDHLHHRLMGIGFSQVQAVSFMYLVSVIFALAALVLERATAYQAALLLIQGFFILITVTVLMIVGRAHLEKSRLLESKLKKEIKGKGAVR